jgi:cytochrome c556
MQRIMQAMAGDMNQIAEGLWREDYALVRAGAQGVAEHPLPSFTEKLALLGRLGSDAPRFMEADEALQATALELVRVAATRQSEPVLRQYQRLQQRCIACHRWYRGAVRANEADSTGEYG